MRREVVIYTSNRKPIPMEGRALVTVRCYFTGYPNTESPGFPCNIMAHYEATGPTIGECKERATVMAQKDGWVVTSIRNVVPA